MSARYKRFCSFGPGGLNCPCCGPAPGKNRKRELRLGKKRERREAMREALAE